MKSFIAYILSFVIFMTSFQNSLLFLDYQINRNFYETHCINKDKPEMDCHGKCEMKKESEKSNSLFNLVKIGFEFNIIPAKNVDLPLPQKISFDSEKTSNLISKQNTFGGYLNILPKPPQT